MNVYLIEYLFDNDVKLYPFGAFYSENNENAKEEALKLIFSKTTLAELESDVKGITLLKLKVMKAKSDYKKDSFIPEATICVWNKKEYNKLMMVNKCFTIIGTQQEFENLYNKKYDKEAEKNKDDYFVIYESNSNNTLICYQFSCHCDIKAKEYFNKLFDNFKAGMKGFSNTFKSVHCDKVIDVYSNVDKVLI